MKYALAAFLAVSLGSIPLSAQSATGSAVSPTSHGVAGMEGIGGAAVAQYAKIGQPPTSACPISMRLQHRSDGNLVRTQSAHPKGTGQLLHLTLTVSDSKQITNATMAVYGISPKGRVENAAKGQYPSSETLTSTVPFVASGNGSFSADFWVPGMTAVQLIELKSIQYSDGSTWKLADGQSCQAKPDLFMLIASQ
jgi:hypothetical protein